ncbi:MAG TPA: hypothetical protein VGP96_07555 [Candidatus Dormibacteraeota bacterium]|nr:hypothetical protein [Candidatus Dormibacteraeota bacterium]
MLTRILLHGLSFNHGHFVYALDDPYIHLTMARNLTEHATWGVTPGDYQSASSSPAWTLLVAALLRVAGRGAALIPLALNVAAALLLLLLFVRGQPLLRQPSGRVWALAVAALLPPALLLPGLTVAGMEPIAMAVVAVAVLALLQRILERRATRLDRSAYLGLLALLPLLRFEGLFLAAGCALALLLDIRWPAAPHTGGRASRLLTAALTAAVPAATTGVSALVNLAHGQYALPNSVVAKSTLATGGLSALVPSLQKLGVLLSTDGMLVALLAALAVYVVLSFAGGPRRHLGLGVAVLLAALLHCSYAQLGTLDRYQEYLVVAAVFVAMRMLAEVTLPRWRSAAVALLVAPLVLVPVHKFVLTTQAATAMNNIYEQQLQMATFLESRYAGQPVALNDIGLVSYRHRGALLDLEGLASFEVLRERRAGTLDSAAVGRIVAEHGVHVVVIYDSWFGGLIPAQWTLVAQWTISRADITVGAPVVSWYAPTPADAVVLAQRLHGFDGQLPAEVPRRFVLPVPRDTAPATGGDQPTPRATGSSKAAERLTGGASPNSRTRPHAVIV